MLYAGCRKHNVSKNDGMAEMEKVIKIAEINFWPKKISTKKWPKNDSK